MIFPILYGLLCVAFAYLNAWLIAKGRRIYHALNGLLHIVVAILIGYFTRWQYGVALLFIVRLVFDTALNLFRGLPIDYVSLKPKSIVDQLEKKVFGMNGYLPKIIYLVIIIILFIV